MNFESIDEIYRQNEMIRARLLSIAANMRPEDAGLLTEKGDWTVSNIFEHLVLVENGMTKIAAKLLSKAKDKGLSPEGPVKVSRHFIDAAAKSREEGNRFEAPDIVKPKDGQPIADSLAALVASRKELDELRPAFDECDGTAFTFPHPYFGELTAIDWLVLIGGHETRHIEQIVRILSLENAAKA